MSSTNESQLLTRLAAAARTSSQLIALGLRAETDQRRRLLRFRFTLPGGEAFAHLRLSQGSIVMTMSGRQKGSRQELRRVLLGAARLVVTRGESHRITEFAAETVPKEIMRSLAAWVQSVSEEADLRHRLALGQQQPGPDDVFGFWADVRSNFGDQIGPWLIQELTGRRAINSRYSTTDHGRMIATVGSIIHMLPTSATSAVDIWGSGLMRRPTEAERAGLRRLNDVAVHAVRGRMTRRILQEELGWNVPEVYGDPALLCPRYFTPEVSAVSGGIAVVPHFKHIEHHAPDAAAFQKAVGGGVNVVDVHADLRDVITQIAAADVCLSSSLHGLIIAQAYGVPWVWLHTPDKNIGGARFKFDDFFSTLESPESVAVHEVPVGDLLTLPYAKIAAEARLPQLSIDLDALQRAFPVTPAATRSTPLQPSFRWSSFSAEDRFMAEVRAAYRLAR